MPVFMELYKNLCLNLNEIKIGNGRKLVFKTKIRSNSSESLIKVIVRVSVLGSWEWRWEGSGGETGYLESILKNFSASRSPLTCGKVKHIG